MHYLRKLKIQKKQSNRVQGQLHEQKVELKDLADKLKAVLREVQALSLQSDITSEMNVDMDVGNVEGE